MGGGFGVRWLDTALDECRCRYTRRPSKAVSSHCTPNIAACASYWSVQGRTNLHILVDTALDRCMNAIGGKEGTYCVSGKIKLPLHP